MSITSKSALGLIKAGANLEITEAAGFTSASVLELVKEAAERGVHITIHASKFTSTTLLGFVEAAPSNVTIVI
ncbi:hypothetical protein [Hyalangium gracile]|uniref:hypothetical protein n=1 Tax=Hyalangium gracile TaxID=394092 RepID=UPI001CCC5BDA|nr:hypothetical protein [Hyalangium gracile]